MKNGKKYLINSDSWFICPNGRQYRAAFGVIEILDDSTLGIKTNRNASNWFVKIGSNESHIIIAGCQIHHAIRCESVCTDKCVTERRGETKEPCTVDNPIYIF